MQYTGIVLYSESPSWHITGVSRLCVSEEGPGQGDQWGSLTQKVPLLVLRLVLGLHCADNSQQRLLPKKPCSPPHSCQWRAVRKPALILTVHYVAMKSLTRNGPWGTPQRPMWVAFSSATWGSTLGPLATLLRNQELVLLRPASCRVHSSPALPKGIGRGWFGFYIHFGAYSLCHVLGPWGCFGWHRTCYWIYIVYKLLHLGRVMGPEIFPKDVFCKDSWMAYSACAGSTCMILFVA